VALARGYYNGFGGKSEEGETVLQAAVREVQEESMVQVEEKDLQQVADVVFVYKDRTLHVPTFFVSQWEGEPMETQEMKPAWFSYDAVPYEQMWEDDRHWMPRVFNGEKLRGTVWFAQDGTSIESMEWEQVENFI
tara:strand:+ start:829 stop:1233 length:405 start_codon:yes stop_codon:yes gene_type:complete